jgi:hypothetical protein
VGRDAAEVGEAQKAKGEWQTELSSDNWDGRAGKKDALLRYGKHTGVHTVKQR